MSEAEEWRARAQTWRLLAERGEDAILNTSLLVLADEADAIAAETDSESGRRDWD